MADQRAVPRYESFLTIDDGTRLRYALHGRDDDAPTLVLCDGVGCDGFVWQRLIPTFEGHFRILHVHYRGHGRSDVPQDLGTLTIERFARDLCAVMDETGIAQGVLIGHSMGVQVTLEFYKLFPERVAALVPMCGSYQYLVDTFHDSDVLKRALPYIRRVIKSFPGLVRGAQRAARPELSFLFGLLVELNPDRARTIDMYPYFQHLQVMDLDVFFTSIHHAAQHTADAVLSRIAVPTLIFSATRDSFTPSWLSDEMHDRIPNSEICVLREGSHAAPIEYHDLVELRLEKFLLDHGFLRA
jgi:pimeloyl-ACP methyl ester carboxylesterase